MIFVIIYFLGLPFSKTSLILLCFFFSIIILFSVTFSQPLDRIRDKYCMKITRHFFIDTFGPELLETILCCCLYCGVWWGTVVVSRYVQYGTVEVSKIKGTVRYSYCTVDARQCQSFFLKYLDFYFA